MKIFDVILYARKDGSVPVKDFIMSLSGKIQAKVLMEIDLLEEYGNELDGKYTKYITKGIYELRVRISSNRVRILFFFYSDKKIILTNGFIKKTQKTPIREIETALKYREDFFNREENWLWNGQK